MTSYFVLATPLLGDLLLIANAKQLTGIYFAGSEHAPVIQDDWEMKPQQEIMCRASDQLQDYLGGNRTSFTLDLHATGTAFQEEVWRQIAMIPFGQTITYAELAKRAGVPHAIRAAGTATGKNAFSIVVPCHRVVAKNGTLGGYAGGLDRKRNLLAVETGIASIVS